jgi:hypothetical protein
MKAHIVAIGAIVLVLAGFLLAWGIYRPKPAKPETPAAAVREKDGSLELEREPSGISSTAPAGTKPLRADPDIPKGGKVVRVVEVTVDPGKAQRGVQTPGKGTIVDPGGPLVARCPPVTTDLTIVRMPDKSERVLASSPDGTVVGGIDVPVQAPKIPRIQRWTAEGLVGYDTHAGRNVVGGQVSYSRGPFVASGGVIGGTAFVGAGIKF